LLVLKGDVSEVIRHQGRKLRCRYIARPAFFEKSLSLTGQGKVRYELKTSYRDGTTHIIFEPLDFIAKPAALVPKPRVNLTCLDSEHPCSSPYGQPTLSKFIPDEFVTVCSHPTASIVFRWRLLAGAKTTRRNHRMGHKVRIYSERQAAMTWAQLLKRVFNIDIKTCRKCGGSIIVIASIELIAILPD
jgi:hypothetical protein